MEVLSSIYTSINNVATIVVKHVDIKYGWALIVGAGLVGVVVIALLLYFGRSKSVSKKREETYREILMEDDDDLSWSEPEKSVPVFDNEILNKLKNSEFVSPHFQVDIIGRNRHGIAAFGYEWGENRGYSLYWTDSIDDDFFKVEGVCERLDDGKTTVATSEDGKYNFRYLKQSITLNNEPAEMILTLIIK